jgi:lysophospholipase L1-like esterase
MPFDAVSFALAKNPTPGVFNYRRDSLPRWKVARAKARMGEASPKLACIGDSTTAGLGAGTGGTKYTDARARSMPAQLAAMLTARDPRLKTTYANVWANSGDGGLVTGNPQLTLGTGWANSAGPSPGGNPFSCSTNGAGVLGWAPQVQADTIVIYWVRNSGTGTFTYSVDGGAASAPIATSGAHSLQSTSISVPLGVHSLAVNRVDGAGTVYIAGFEMFNSAAPSVRVQNMGHSGSTAAIWVAANVGYAPLPGVATYAPDLTIINLGINDVRTLPATITDGTFTANMRTIITNAQISGDVVLMVPHLVVPSGGSQALEVILRGLIYDLATEKDCVVVNMAELLGTYAASSARGLFFDTLHLNAAGYDHTAGFLADVLLLA